MLISDEIHSLLTGHLLLPACGGTSSKDGPSQESDLQHIWPGIRISLSPI